MQYTICYLSDMDITTADFPATSSETAFDEFAALYQQANECEFDGQPIYIRCEETGYFQSFAPDYHDVYNADGWASAQ